MTDEPREENKPEDEDVEGHGPLGPAPDEKFRADEDDDVEGHGPIGPAPTIGPEPTIGP
jgi:hypothetical protein